MENRITEKENDVAIKNLKRGLDSSWDTFLYGAIVGQREVLKNRGAIKEQLNNQQYER